MLLRNIFKIDPQKPLHHHILFWVPISIFGLLGIYVGVSTSEFGLEHLVHPKRTMDALAYPIFIFSLALPLILAIGRFHASAQRAQSIRISNSTMSFKHYFDHRDAFAEYLKLHQSGSRYIDIRVSKPFRLYDLYYPNSEMSRFDLTPSYEAFDLMQAKIDSVEHRLCNLLESKGIDSIEVVSGVFESLGLVIEFNEKALKAFYSQGLKDGTSPLKDILGEIWALLEYVNEFDRNNIYFAESVSAALYSALEGLTNDNRYDKLIRASINRLIFGNDLAASLKRFNI